MRHNIDTNFNVDQLIAHFKFFHHFASSNNFFCLECLHTYQSLKAFKRHFKNTNTCLAVSTNNTDFLINDATSSETSTHPVFHSNQSTNSDKLHSILERIETSALLFMSNLYSKSNFARTDVEEIVSDIISKLLNKIFSELEQFFTENFQGEQIQFKQFNIILKFCKNPFENFKFL